MKNDTIKLLESIQSNLNESDINKEQFISMLTPTINKVYKFAYQYITSTGNVGFAADIYDSKAYLIGTPGSTSIRLGFIGYNKYSDDYDVYVDIIKDDEVISRKEKRYISIEEAIDFLDQCANEQLNISNS